MAEPEAAPSAAATANGTGPHLGPGRGAKKCALFLAYVGEGYHGMQHQPNGKTIENELLRALKTVGAVPETYTHGEADWSRAARTDRGVSALANVVSLLLPHPLAPNLVPRLNAALPAQIRVLGVVRAPPGFTARQADRRRYEYALPAACFDPGYALNRASRQALEVAAAAAEAAPRERADTLQAAQAGGSADDTMPQQGQQAAPADDGEERPGANAATNGARQGAEASSVVPAPTVADRREGTAAAAATPAAAKATANGHASAVASELPGQRHDRQDAAASEGHASPLAGVSVPGLSQGVQSPPAPEAVEAPPGSSTPPGTAAAQVAGGGGAAAGAAGTTRGAGSAETAPQGGPPGDPQQAQEGQPQQQGGALSGEALRAKIDAIGSAFHGTHSYHNFTFRPQDASPASLVRFIHRFACAGTLELEGETWVRLEIVGQSFVMHQIRKMVGLLLAVARGVAPPGAVPAALDPQRCVTTPLAPETGLFLVEPSFAAHNRRWAGPGKPHAPLEAEPYRAEIERFRGEVLLPTLGRLEARGQAFRAFLRSLNPRNYPLASTADYRPRAAAAVPLPRQEALESQSKGLALPQKRPAEEEANALQTPCFSWKKGGGSGGTRASGPGKQGGRDGMSGTRKGKARGAAVPASLAAEWSD